MSEPDNPRWLNEISDELRQEVPVRAAWRARLLEDVAQSRRPVEDDDVDDRVDETEVRSHAMVPRRRQIVLGPLSGIAAALVFAAVGAGVMYVTMSSHGRAVESAALDPDSQRGASTVVPTRLASSAASTDRETVRFELAAPNASHVALVGSFNEWNPVATPLMRDPATGKWMVTLRLPPGRHVYSFVVDGDVTADPAAPRAADDDFGSSNSVVLVAERAS